MAAAMTIEEVGKLLGTRVFPDPECPWRRNIVLRQPPVQLNWREGRKGWEAVVDELDVCFRVEPARRGGGFNVSADWPGGKWLGLRVLSDDQEIAKAVAGYLATGLMPIRSEPIDL